VAFTCPDNKGGTEDESRLSDSDVMVVLALINTMCLMGFPRYSLRPASLTYLVLRLRVIGSSGEAYKSSAVLQTPNISVKTSYIKNKLLQQSCKIPQYILIWQSDFIVLL